MDNEPALDEFCYDLDVRDGYLKSKKKRIDVHVSVFFSQKLLYTPLLSDHRRDEFDEEIIDNLNQDALNQRLVSILRKVVRKRLSPKLDITIPIVHLGEDFSLSAVSRVFTTINKTGKVLTSYELVVAMLYPGGVNVEEDRKNFNNSLGFFENTDRTGEILLQLVCLLDNKSPKKSDFPKNLNTTSYKSHAATAAKFINKTGEFLSEKLGAGLDHTDRLLPYDAIIAPMAAVFCDMEKDSFDEQKVGAIHTGLKKWFVAAALTQRYQEGVHNKQQADRRDIASWLLNDGEEPQWLKEAAFQKTDIVGASPNGAIGRLVLCLWNSARPTDPKSDKKAGYFDNAESPEIHHIYPSRWLKSALPGIKRERSNTVLNTMLVAATTNRSFSNLAPDIQINDCKTHRSCELSAVASAFEMQNIPRVAFDVLNSTDHSEKSFSNVIENRYQSVSTLLQTFSVKEALVSEDDEDERNLDLEDQAANQQD